LALLIAYRLLTGGISLNGLLTMDGEQFSPERAQLLVASVAGLLAYATATLSQGKFPEIPNSLLALFAASHFIYIGGKVSGR